MPSPFCPRTIALRQGEVVYDGPSAALTPAVLRDLYGAQATTFCAGRALRLQTAEPLAPPGAGRRRWPGRLNSPLSTDPQESPSMKQLFPIVGLAAGPGRLGGHGRAQTQGTQLRHHLDRVVAEPEVRLAAAARRHGQEDRLSRSTPSSRPTTPASSKACASTRCTWPGMGNKSAMEAVDRASGEVFAQMVNADGTQGYYSHLIVHKDSPLKTLDDVLKNAQEPDASASATRTRPRASWCPATTSSPRTRSIRRTDFKRVACAPTTRPTPLAVANKQVDVATNNSENLRQDQGRRCPRSSRTSA